MPQDKELEWNLGGERVRALGSILFELRRSYAKAKHTEKYGDVREYATLLYTLYMEIFAYMEPENEKETGETLDKLTKDMRDAKNNAVWKQESTDIVHELMQVDKALNAARIEAGLDIPASVKLNPEDGDVLVKGLRDG